jgi:hypothetical protein
LLLSFVDAAAVVAVVVVVVVVVDVVVVAVVVPVVGWPRESNTQPTELSTGGCSLWRVLRLRPGVYTQNKLLNLFLN